MKKFVSTLLLLIFSLVALNAATYLTPNKPSTDVSLAWDPSPDATVVGYYIYFGSESRGYTNRVAVGNVTNYTIKGLSPGVRYYFTATAFDAVGLESDFCNEVFYLVPKSPAPVPKIWTTNAVVKVSLQKASSPTGPWYAFADMTTDTAYPGFYRAKVAISYPEYNSLPSLFRDPFAVESTRSRVQIPPIPNQGN